MAEAKWIKIVTDIFDDEKMVLIDSLPDHDSIIVIWFKLLCLAGKQNNGGAFLLGEKTPYTEEMLAKIIRRSPKILKKSLEIFKKFGMIEVVENTISIPNWDRHQSLNSYEKKRENDRLRQAKRREEQRTESEKKSRDSRVTGATKSRDVTLAEEEIDKDIDIYKEKEIHKEKESVTQSATQMDCPYSQIKDLYHDICVSYPKIRAIDGERKRAVAARWNSCKSIDTFRELFTIAEGSAFMKGENDRNWRADFDWMMKPTNFSKVLEGKYNREQKQTSGTGSRKTISSFETDEALVAALKRSYGEDYERLFGGDG